MVTNKGRSSSLNPGFEGKRVATIKKSGSITGDNNIKGWATKAVVGGGLKKKS